MKALILIFMCSLTIAVAVGLRYESEAVKQRSAIAERDLDLYNLRREVEIDALRLQDAKLNEQIAQRQHKSPDHLAVERAQARLDSARDTLRMTNDIDSMPLPSN